jgi:hypothetical protein
MTKEGSLAITVDSGSPGSSVQLQAAHEDLTSSVDRKVTTVATTPVSSEARFCANMTSVTPRHVDAKHEIDNRGPAPVDLAMEAVVVSPAGSGV